MEIKACVNCKNCKKCLFGYKCKQLNKKVKAEDLCYAHEPKAQKK